ncbi:alpha/beta hydrolase [Enterococcus faecalis]
MIKIIDFFVYTFVIIAFLFLLVLVVLYFTPNPIFKIANSIPIEENLSKPDNYSNIESSVTVNKNIPYTNEYKNNKLDIYSPKDFKGKLPVVLFIHGGGFFKGDKEMAKYFGPTISNSHYSFISINYDLAPDTTLFNQVQQINEAIKFIKKNENNYCLDTSSINLSGSSAGGFLALQLLSAYHNKKYTKELQIIPVENIKFNSLLLYSSVYNLSEFQKFNGNILTNYLLSKIGWGLTGEKKWKTNRDLGEKLNLNNYVNSGFPPIFITDGNTKTFTAQAEDYANILIKKHVPVKTLFFDSKNKVGHGYQLKMNTEASKQAVKESLKFLQKWN